MCTVSRRQSSDSTSGRRRLGAKTAATLPTPIFDSATCETTCEEGWVEQVQASKEEWREHLRLGTTCENHLRVP